MTVRCQSGQCEVGQAGVVGMLLELGFENRGRLERDSERLLARVLG
jgi:hypothetical protein